MISYRHKVTRHCAMLCTDLLSGHQNTPRKACLVIPGILRHAILPSQCHRDSSIGVTDCRCAICDGQGRDIGETGGSGTAG